MAKMAPSHVMWVLVLSCCVILATGTSPPAFTGSYPVLESHPEGTATPAGTPIHTFTATDPEGVTPVLSYTYDPADTYLMLTITETTSAGSTTAAVTLATGKELDYETQSTYKIYVNAYDGVDTSEDVLLTLQVTDVGETPTLNPATAVQNFSIAESPTGTVIGQPAFNVSDGDFLDVHTWNITGGTGTSYINVFSVNGTAMLMADYDLETPGTPTDVYVDVEIVDKYGLSVTLTYSLFVSDSNDNLPAFSPTLYTFEVNQTLLVGTVLATLNATDADVTSPNNAITYTLDAAYPIAAYFNLTSNGDLVLGYTMDITYGTGPYVFYALATDGGSTAYTATATISLTTPPATTTPTTTTDTPPAGYDWSGSSENQILMIIACFVAACLLGYVLVLCWRWHTFGECLPARCPTSQECNKCCECCHDREDEERITGFPADFGPSIFNSKKGLEAMGKPTMGTFKKL